MKYIWENPEIIKENKEDGHVIAMCYDDKGAAKNREKSPYKISLNGEWKFKWEKGIGGFPKEFTAADFDDSAWEDITIPGVWQLQKDYSKPWYMPIPSPTASALTRIKSPQ